MLRNSWQKLWSICKLLLLQALVCHFYKLEPGGRFTSDVYLEAVCAKFYRVCIYSKHACFTYSVMNLSMMRFRRTTRSFRTIGTRTYVCMSQYYKHHSFSDATRTIPFKILSKFVSFYSDVAFFISSAGTISKVASDELLPTD